MLTRVIIDIKSVAENQSNVLEELKKIEFTKSNPVYSARLLRFCLTLRYTSLPANKLLQNEFNLPSVFFLRKQTSGKIDTLASA